ncbi:MotA/TolQ/ExbB proton channel family protein [Ideonella livida]|uniref:Biopolymer transport protein ExbB n=1 Tax=Ideonella livida TaxID=2707176 RepID=A0A7C9TL25_9BURK|nr:MotA/TolQ/ExbB proton channel family protein [Ideonella livida]NDY91983.1 MotA/TolQ/ExbB proton channel family protein [Ideonella livida]
MGGLADFWAQSDTIGRAVALVLLGLSVTTWVTLLWRGWLLHRVRRDLPRAVRAFWEAPGLDAGRERLAALDREGIAGGLVAAAFETPNPASLQGQADRGAQLTRRLRDALHDGLGRLQAGQVLLASVGATSPFIGLFGTVWGIYHALLGMATAGSLNIERVAGPVGEALIMTAAGLAVAIPAVLAYNLFSKWLGALEADLEGLAHDLRELVLGHPVAEADAGTLS